MYTHRSSYTHTSSKHDISPSAEPAWALSLALSSTPPGDAGGAGSACHALPQFLCSATDISNFGGHKVTISVRSGTPCPCLYQKDAGHVLSVRGFARTRCDAVRAQPAGRWSCSLTCVWTQPANLLYARSWARRTACAQHQDPLQSQTQCPKGLGHPQRAQLIPWEPMAQAPVVMRQLGTYLLRSNQNKPALHQ